MTAVERVRVGDVLRLERRPVDVAVDEEYEEIGVRSFGRGIFHKDPVTGAALGAKRVFWIEQDDLVISNVFAWEGAIAVASVAESRRIGSHRFMTFVPIGARIDVAWASWFFRSEPGLELIRGASPGSAGRNRTLAVKRFEDLEIPLPAIDEQRRIAAQLDRVSMAAKKIRRRSAHARVLRSAFNVATAARPELTEAERLAAGWQQIRVGDVMRVCSDPVAVDPNESYANFGIYGFGRGLFAKPDIDGATTSAKTLNRVRAGQFIYSRLFAFEGAYASIDAEFDGCFVSNEFPTFNADPAALDPRWFATYLRSPERWAELAVTSKGLGVRRQRVPVESLLAYEAWLPPLEQQLAMIQTVERVEMSRGADHVTTKRIESLVPAVLNATFGDPQ